MHLNEGRGLVVRTSVRTVGFPSLIVDPRNSFLCLTFFVVISLSMQIPEWSLKISHAHYFLRLLPIR